MTTPTPIIQPGVLKRLRIQHDLTQAQLATLAGISRQTVNSHERGDTAINLQASNAYRWALRASAGGFSCPSKENR